MSIVFVVQSLSIIGEAFQGNSMAFPMFWSGLKKKKVKVKILASVVSSILSFIYYLSGLSSQILCFRLSFSLFFSFVCDIIAIISMYFGHVTML